MEGSGRRVDCFERHDPPRRVAAPDHLRPSGRSSVEAHAAGSQEHQAQGSQGLDDRRQADQAARYRAQAQRQQGLRHRPEAAGDAQCGDQGRPGLRQQDQERGRIQSRQDARRAQGGAGEGYRRRRRRRHVVAGEDCARCVADRLGRGRQRQGVERDDREAPGNRPHRDRDQRRPARRRCAGRDRRRGEEDRGDIFDAVPVPCLHGSEQRHGPPHRRPCRVLDADAESRSFAGGAFIGVGTAADAMRGLIATIWAAASAGAAAPRTMSARR